MRGQNDKSEGLRMTEAKGSEWQAMSFWGTKWRRISCSRNNT